MMFQRFKSYHELKSSLSLDNFGILPDESEYRCVYCGTDLYEILYEDECNTYVRCNLCNAFWIMPGNSLNYAK
jgi:hypothetical protein